MTASVSGVGAATIEEVAATAGVSRSTVSRVVNGSTSVSPQAREAVTRAIAQLEYVPNRAARSLARRQTHAIALVVPEDITRFFGDPYFAAVVSGIHSRINSSDYVLNLLIESGAEGKTSDYLRAGYVDGALVVSHHGESEFLERLSMSMPVVYGGRPLRRGDYFVDVDNRTGARTATEYLIATGHRDIRTITGPPDMPASVDRTAGFEDALRAAGLEIQPSEEGDFTEMGGRDAMWRILQSDRVPEAIFAQSDLMASGAMAVLATAGLVVPDDIAIVGFDDSPVATRTTPHLTTMRQPSFKQGAVIADMLIARLAGEETPSSVILDAELVVRASA